MSYMLNSHGKNSNYTPLTLAADGGSRSQVSWLLQQASGRQHRNTKQVYCLSQHWVAALGFIDNW